jgi:UDP-glucuronate 4-epimerase
MNCLVTGGAGFIGSHLVERLLEGGHQVVCVDNLNPYYDPALKQARLARFRDRVRFEHIDIADRAALEAVFRDGRIDKVCHLAAQAGVRYSLENPFVYADANYVGTMNVLELAKRHGVEHVVFASTSSVYGLREDLPLREEDRTDRPISIYSATKRACELLASCYHDLFGLNVTCLRFFTVYGPWGRPDMALFRFVRAILSGEPIDVYNHGDMKRDFTYVSDIVDGFYRALGPTLGFAVVNLGSGSPVQLLDFVRLVEREVGKTARLNFLPMQPGDVQETHAAIDKAKRLLGWEPRVRIEEGVQRFVEWYREFYRE